MSAQNAQRRAARYLRTAAVLLEDGDYESSVSRAYYAMFYVVRELLRQKGVEPNTHSGTLNQFGLHYVKTGIVSTRLGQAFREALELRQFAEYAEERVISREEAAAVLGEARAFVEEAAALLTA